MCHVIANRGSRAACQVTSADSPGFRDHDLHGQVPLARRVRLPARRGHPPRRHRSLRGLGGGPCFRETLATARAISPESARRISACRRLARARWTGSAHGGDGRRADSGLRGFHADVASAKSFYSDVLGWETDDQPIGAFTYTVMRSADAGDEQRSERHHAAQPEMAAARATPRWASRSPTAMLRQPPGRQSSILSRASLVTRFVPSAERNRAHHAGRARAIRSRRCGRSGVRPTGCGGCQPGSAARSGLRLAGAAR